MTYDLQTSRAPRRQRDLSLAEHLDDRGRDRLKLGGIARGSRAGPDVTGWVGVPRACGDASGLSEDFVLGRHIRLRRCSRLTAGTG
jgi:hypothetical protein